MTEELAEYLIGLEKHILEDNQLLDKYNLKIDYPMDIRLTLSTKDDLDQILLINIKESEKKTLKISMHHQDHNTQKALLRIDYNGRHLNPVEITPTLPKIFRPFAGKWLDDYPSHIHYVVNGYKPLAWAIPLEYDEFPIQDIKSREEYSQALSAFFKKINLQTNITYTHQLRII